MIAAIAFVRQAARRPFGAAVCAWWAGQNLVDLAPYIADARALQLVLLGGRTGAEVEGHDWEYLLTSSASLHLDRHARPAPRMRSACSIMVAALAYAVGRSSRKSE